MSSIVWNFSAGPAILPKAVLERAQQELLDWQGLGVSVMEISHRSPEFEALVAHMKALLRRLLGLPDTFEILFTTGGGQGQFAFVPMNLLHPEEYADYLITGGWSNRAAREAARFANVHVVADAASNGYTAIPEPSTWSMNAASKYFHYATNETVHGLQFHHVPEVEKPLVADMSSDFLSYPLSFDRFGLIYSASQKNIGPAGLTIVLIRRDWLTNAIRRVPEVFDYKSLASTDSMPNTPATFIWYLSALVFEWLEAQGGVAAMQKKNQRKSSILYEAIDESNLYQNSVEKSTRSQMNVVFDLIKPDLLPRFLEEARGAGLVGLKGHKTRGGVRASLYNAMPEEGVCALIEFMRTFEKKYA